MVDVSKMVVSTEAATFDYNPKKVSTPAAKGGYPSIIYAYAYPTGNCQMWGLCYANNILSVHDAKDIQKIVAKIGRIAANSSKQVLIDVHDKYLEKLEKAFLPEQFVVKEKYISTNGSKMLLCLIKVDYTVLDK